MKKDFFKINFILAIIIIIQGCQKEYPIVFDRSASVVGFSKSTLTIKENGGDGVVNIYLGAMTGMAATDVSVEVSVEGIPNPAVEGTDFTIPSKNVPAGVGETAITITPVDNNLFQGNKQFKLIIKSNSKSYPISAQNTMIITITDDEHPLKAWIGTYKVNAVSYGNPGNWDELWTVTTTPVDGKLNQLYITGFGYGSTVNAIATLDLAALTITINSGQDLGEAYGPDNGTVRLYFGTADIIDILLAQAEVNSSMLLAAEAFKITGTLEQDGTIHIDKMGMILTDFNWCWDVFNTTWTKQ